MRLSEVGVVTITLARNTNEERQLLSAVTGLTNCGVSVISADGGSSESFVSGLKRVGLEIVTPRRKGLVNQVKAGLKAAMRVWPNKGIVYTEPDKYPFFGERLAKFVSAVRESDVSIASRDARSFRTFPKGQRWTEAFTNQAAELMLGKKGDYCYGPMLLSRRAAELALQAPEDLGWGWRFWLFATARKEGLRLKMVTLDLPCPKEQRGEDTRADRIYRLKQMRQNLAGLELGLSK